MNRRTLSAQRAATILDHQDRIRIAPVKALNSPFRETNLSITPDGKYLYFMSLRGGLENSSQIMTFEGDSVYDGDIWYSERVNGAWQRPKAMPSGVNTANGEDEPVVSADGKRVYFQSWNYIWDRTGGPYFVSELQGNIWTRPVGLGGGITEFFSVVQATDGMTISPDERTMIVAAGQGYHATFMGRPIAEAVGSGLHVNFSLIPVGGGRNVFDDPAHAGLREQLTALIHARPDDAGPIRQAIGSA